MLKAVAGAMAILVTLLLAYGVADPVELPVRDAALRFLPPKPATETVVVAIDEPSVRADRLGPWPWSRPQLAAIVDRLADSGARGVLIDILLTDVRPGDDQLARALRRLPSAAVSVLDDRGEWLVPSPLIQMATTPAHGNFELDNDGIVRRFATTKQSRNRSLAALSVEAASIRTGAPIPIGISITPAFRTRASSVPRLSAASLMVGEGGSGVRGKLVFIGPTALGLGDRVLTPVSRHVPDPGVTVHAAATESLIRHEVIRGMPPIVSGLVAAGAVAILLAANRVRLAALALIVGIPVAGELLLATGGVAIPFATLEGCVVVTLAAVEARSLLAALRRTEGVAARLRRDQEQEADSKRLLAHELKTPLASMRGLTQLLAQFELSEPERRRVTSLLEAEAGKLQSLVGGLLDLERLPLRDFDTAATVINLGDLVGARLEFLRASADRPLLMEMTQDVLVRGDAALLERVVDNLVGNALKYARPPEPVRVAVRSDGGEGVLEVEDRGPGLSPDDRERVFQRFFRGATAGGTQGLGLGLSLVAEVARWHGGKIEVEAAAAGGSLFRFSLPRAGRELREERKT
jgi:signal transduction histidine kinase